ncbi:MEIOTIC F-BOX protein MOF-like [Panicum virgatum]|uniref:MEIOTIC F-BOX protein MOF-like n=1 Tax=Panicum virgatum TaxID=38727 RepID=UPI0019D5BAB1|nr:MEIOTIC F-BOX protein MOF-like [Panicum virgatum]
MMEAPCKRRRGDDDEDAGDRDRLNALPDSLLREVMSHMKARQVVQTCVLARRWRNLWRSMPCLDVDQDEFTTAGVSVVYSDHEGWERFEDFMDTLLCPGNVSIALLDTLRLHASSMGEDRRASRWIRRGIKYPHAGQEPGLQRGAPSCSSWRLRRLHLSNLYLCNLLAEHVRSRCPSLEDLELESCTCEFPAIASRSLKNLVLKRCALKGFREITSPPTEEPVYQWWL